MIVVEELFARLGLEVDGAAFDVANKMIGAVRGGMIGMVAAAGAAALGILAAAAKTAQYADATAKAAQRTGIAVDSLQALQYAAERADVSTGDLEGALRFAAKRGVKDLEGELRRAAAQFERMPDGAEKAALAMKLFGKNGGALIPMLNKGTAGLDEMTAKARDMGLVLDAETQAQGEALKDTIEDVQGYLRGLAYTIAGPFLKPIREALEKLAKWIRDHRPQIQKAFEAIGSAIGVAFKYAFQLIEPVVDLLGRFIGWVLGSQMGRVIAVMAALGFALAAPWGIPLVAVILLLAALEELWGWVTGERKTLLGDWLGDFNKLLDVDPSDSLFTRGMKDLVWLVKEFCLWMDRSAKAWDALAGRLAGGMVKGGQEHAKYLGLSDAQKSAIWDRAQAEADANPGVNVSNRAAVVQRRVDELTASMYAPAAPQTPTAPGLPSHSSSKVVNVGPVTIHAADGTDAGRKFMDMIRSHSDAEYSAALPAAGRP